MATIPIRFPAAGMYRALAQQRQDPYTTPDCQNVRPFDSIAGRARGGLRPGMKKYPGLEPGDADPINLLSCLNVSGEAGSVSLTFLEDMRDGLDPTLWATSPFLVEVPGIGVTIDPSNEVVGFGVARMTIILGLDENRPYTVTLKNRWVNSPTISFSTHHSVIRINLGLDGSAIGFAAGLWLQVELRSTFDPPRDNGIFTQTFQITIRQMSGTSPDRDLTSKTIIGHNASPGNVELSVTVSGGDMSAKLETELSSETYGFTTDSVTLGGTSGNLLGFYLARRLLDGVAARPLLTDFQVDYFKVAASAFPNPDCLLVVAKGGKVFAGDGAGAITEVAGSLRQRTRPLMAASALVLASEEGAVPIRTEGSKLFIADYDPGDPSVLPKYYDPDRREVFPWERDTGPEVPQGNHIIAGFQGRLYLAGNPPNAFQASVIGDPFDWHFDGDDPSTALLAGFNDLSLGAPIRGMAPHTNDFMLMWTANQTFRMSGDMRLGGTLLSISTQAGLAGPFAWTITPDGSIVWLDQERGLFQMAPGATGYPIPISDNRLPRELKNIDPSVVNVTVVYDHIGVGCQIILASPQGREHWWYDWRLKGFWLDAVHADRQMLTAFDYQSSSPHKSGLLLGGNDGVLRFYSDKATSDDGKEIKNHIVLGPFVLAGRDHVEGSVEWIRATTAPADTPLHWEVFTSSNAEDALSGRRRREKSGTFGALNDSRIDPGFKLDMQRHEVRRAGVVGLIKLTGVPGQAWALESLDLNVVALQEAFA